MPPVPPTEHHKGIKRTSKPRRPTTPLYGRTTVRKDGVEDDAWATGGVGRCGEFKEIAGVAMKSVSIRGILPK